jgi:hypothetical protein
MKVLRRNRFVEQKLMLSSSFRSDRIRKIHCYDFGHTFVVLPKSDLNVEQTHPRVKGTPLNGRPAKAVFLVMCDPSVNEL